MLSSVLLNFLDTMLAYAHVFSVTRSRTQAILVSLEASRANIANFVLNIEACQFQKLIIKHVMDKVEFGLVLVAVVLNSSGTSSTFCFLL